MAKSKPGPLGQLSEGTMEVDPEQSPQTRYRGSGFKAPEHQWHVATDTVNLQVWDAENPTVCAFVSINAAQLVWLMKSVVMCQNAERMVAEMKKPK